LQLLRGLVATVDVSARSIPRPGWTGQPAKPRRQSAQPTWTELRLQALHDGDAFLRSQMSSRVEPLAEQVAQGMVRDRRHALLTGFVQLDRLERRPDGLYSQEVVEAYSALLAEVRRRVLVWAELLQLPLVIEQATASRSGWRVALRYQGEPQVLHGVEASMPLTANPALEVRGVRDGGALLGYRGEQILLRPDPVE
jgi:hypothetical protein